VKSIGVGDVIDVSLVKPIPYLPPVPPFPFATLT